MPGSLRAFFSWLRWLWRGLRWALVFVFVVWQLVFLTFRNPLDLWYRDLGPWTQKQPAWKEWGCDRLDQYTTVYGEVMGIEQGWRMFGSPLARSTPFPAVRLEFSDDTSTTVYSDNEPDPTHYLRLSGGCRQRKLEDYLSSWSADSTARGTESQLWANYVRWIHRRWKAENPNDAREVVRLVVLRRRLYFLEPGATTHEPPWQSEIVAFTPEGKLLP